MSSSLFTTVDEPSVEPGQNGVDEQALVNASVGAPPPPAAQEPNVLSTIVDAAARANVRAATRGIQGTTLRIYGYFLPPTNFTFGETANVQPNGHGNPVANLQFVHLDPNTRREEPIHVIQRGVETQVNLIRVNAYRPWTEFALDGQGKPLIHRTREGEVVTRPDRTSGDLRPVAMHSKAGKLLKAGEDGKFLAFQNPGWAELRVTIAAGSDGEYSNYQLMSFRTADLRYSESVASVESLNLA